MKPARRKKKLSREQIRERSKEQDRRQNPRHGKGRKSSSNPLNLL